MYSQCLLIVFLIVLFLDSNTSISQPLVHVKHVAVPNSLVTTDTYDLFLFSNSISQLFSINENKISFWNISEDSLKSFSKSVHHTMPPLGVGKRGDTLVVFSQGPFDEYVRWYMQKSDSLILIDKNRWTRRKGLLRARTFSDQLVTLTYEQIYWSKNGMYCLFPLMETGHGTISVQAFPVGSPNFAIVNLQPQFKRPKVRYLNRTALPVWNGALNPTHLAPVGSILHDTLYVYNPASNSISGFLLSGQQQFELQLQTAISNTVEPYTAADDSSIQRVCGSQTHAFLLHEYRLQRSDYVRQLQVAEGGSYFALVVDKAASDSAKYSWELTTHSFEDEPSWLAFKKWRYSQSTMIHIFDKKGLKVSSILLPTRSKLMGILEDGTLRLFSKEPGRDYLKIISVSFL